ncbi:zinc-binding alcohol dehydrogenase family protein [Aureimonas populi]|uniref:Zinc-binding alcohol dehydrogenase family protein n=1 Tax=Aureimonas populi TaxID=1701758 RepID=A0ABW5CQC9_9HYPH|nr:zinc-binding alcohol dehydrogenase family protein [Aureimonas populi]
MPMGTMKAVVIRAPGGPEVLRIEERPVPVPARGQVRIAVKAFGLNRSELFTRQGHSPSVAFPRVPGIEAVGIVDEAPGGEFAEGEVVATAMGGMGRRFDGGYAQYTCVPAGQVARVETSLPWEVLGALPEMLQTAWGALFSSLDLREGQRLLVRGGTTSVGMAAIALARRAGARVTATTRRPGRAEALEGLGAHGVLIDDGALAATGQRFDKVLELVGTTTLMDSLACADRGGVVCMAGIVGNKWTIDDFAPMNAIPSRVSLTAYSGGVADFIEMPFQSLVDDIAAGTLPIRLGRVFSLDEIVEAHRCMEMNAAEGKIVVLV